MFLELTQVQKKGFKRWKVTLAASSIAGFTKLEEPKVKNQRTQRMVTRASTLIQFANGSTIEVFEFYRVVQWLLYKAHRVRVASYSPKRDNDEWKAWCVEYMGDKRQEWQEANDDRNYVHPTETDTREITHMDEEGLVHYDDGTKGWLYSYNVLDININPATGKEEVGTRTEITVFNHMPVIKINEAGDPISDSMPQGANQGNSHPFSG
jgi:hypothetical protein